MVGVVLTGPTRSVEAFVDSYSPQFPVLVNPSGTAVSLLPRSATPLTAVFGADGLDRPWLGAIDTERGEALAALTAQGSP